MLTADFICSLWSFAFSADIEIVTDSTRHQEIFEFTETCVLLAWERNFCSREEWYATFDPAWRQHNFFMKEQNAIQ
jgi:hypothetical protein